MSVTILIRGGTAAEWAAADPVLHAREMGLETDTQKFKFGDGATAWSGLPYAGSTGSGTVTDVTATAPLASSGGATPDISITLPADASKYLDGTGNFTTPAGGGTVTDVTATVPLASSGGTTPDISASDFDGTNSGLVPAGPADATKYLDGSGNFTVPAGSGGTVTDVTASAPLASSGGTTPDISASDFDGTNSGLVPAGPADATKYLDGSGNFSVPAGSGGTVTDVTATAPVTSSGGATPDIAVPVFVASGASHASGLVPDPGASGGTTKFLREDATFQVPPGGGSGNVTSTGAAGSEPGSPASGDLYLPNDGFVEERYSGSAWAPWGPLFPLTLPPTASWSWDNQGSSTVTATTNNGLRFTFPKTAGFSWRSYLRSIGANTRLDVAFLPQMIAVAASNCLQGIYLRESATNKRCFWGLYSGSGYQTLLLNRHTDSAGAGSTSPTVVPVILGSPIFLRVDPTGATMNFFASPDGQTWYQVTSLTKTTAFTTGPDQWGIGANAGQATYDNALALVSLKEQ